MFWKYLGLLIFVFVGAGIGAVAAAGLSNFWRFILAGFGAFLGIQAFALCVIAKRKMGDEDEH